MALALGRYELLRPLARGGMGEVYLARRRAAGVEKLLVIKRMRPERVGDPRFLELFVREARLSMSLAHQNIVPVFDFGRIDDQVFIAMERVEGKDLGSSLAQAGKTKPLPPLLAAFIAAECCQALDYAHHRRSPTGAQLGIVHRDVTPRNVLLSWSGEVKLTDFGIAALAGDERSKSAGTPAYMAPEQARGDSVDPRADVYALGMCLREALTGVRARPGFDRDAMLGAACIGLLDPWPEGFDSPLRAIVDRATAKQPEDRYADAHALLTDLDSFIVAERAAHKSAALARQLAAWLADVWVEERDDASTSAEIEASHLVSFVDDGELDVVGTGTARSALATDPDAENPLGGNATDATRPDRPPSPPRMSASANGDPVLAPRRVSADPEAQVTTADRAPQRWPLVALVAAVAIAGTAVFALTRSSSESSPVVAAVARDAAPAIAIAAPPDAPTHIDPPPVDPPPVDPPRVDPPKHPKLDASPKVGPRIEHPPHTGSATAAAPATHIVRINTKPWSYWTADADPTQHTTPDPVSLSVGAHTIHFTGNPHYRADKTITIDVPDNDDFHRVEQLDELAAP